MTKAARSFKEDPQIVRGAARPPGFPETDYPAKQKVVKSKFMEDAEAQARERYEAAQRVQAQARAAQAKREAAAKAKGKAVAEEQHLKGGASLTPKKEEL